MQQVCVQTLGGRTLELSLSADTLISQLKRDVKTHWNILPEHQRLMAGEQELANYDSVGFIVERDQCSVGIPLHVTLISTQEVLPIGRLNDLEALIKRLCHEDSRQRIRAVADLPRVADKSSEREVNFVVEKIGTHVLQSGSIAGKRAGLEALAAFAPQGHHQSIDWAFRCFNDPSEFVRLTAVETVAAIAPRGHEHTILFAKRYLNSKNLSVKAAGIMVLGEVGNSDVMTLLEKASLIEDDMIQNATMDAISSIIRAKI